MEEKQNKTFSKLETNFNQNKQNNPSFPKKTPNEYLSHHDFNYDYTSHSLNNYPNPYNYYMNYNFHYNSSNSYNNQFMSLNYFPREPMNFQCQNYFDNSNNNNHNLYIQEKRAYLRNLNEKSNEKQKKQSKNKSMECNDQGNQIEKKEKNNGIQQKDIITKESKVTSSIGEQTMDNKLNFSGRKKKKKKSKKNAKKENSENNKEKDIVNNNDKICLNKLLLNNSSNNSNDLNKKQINYTIERTTKKQLSFITENEKKGGKNNSELNQQDNKITKAPKTEKKSSTKIKSSKSLESNSSEIKSISNKEKRDSNAIKNRKINKSPFAKPVKSENSNEHNTNNNNILFENPSNLLNPKAPPLTSLYNNFENGFNSNARFFVMKSSDEDNIYKSIKYRVWCSSFTGNKMLNEAFKNAKNEYPIYLIFSVNRSGRFVGICQMISEVNFNSTFVNWNDSEKYRGYFFVVWVSVKDVPSALFANISNQLNSNESVIRSRNNQEIDTASGFEVLRIFRNHPLTSSILDDLIYFEMKEKNKLAFTNDFKNNDNQNNHQIPNSILKKNVEDKAYENKNGTDSIAINNENENENNEKVFINN